MIGDTTLFNVEAPTGKRVGQAAVIRQWEFEDGRKGGVGVVEAVSPEALSPPPSAEELQAAGKFNILGPHQGENK